MFINFTRCFICIVRKIHENPNKKDKFESRFLNLFFSDFLNNRSRSPTSLEPLIVLLFAFALLFYVTNSRFRWLILNTHNFMDGSTYFFFALDCHCESVVLDLCEVMFPFRLWHSKVFWQLHIQDCLKEWLLGNLNHETSRIIGKNQYEYMDTSSADIGFALLTVSVYSGITQCMTRVCFIDFNFFSAQCANFNLFLFNDLMDFDVFEWRIAWFLNHDAIL